MFIFLIVHDKSEIRDTFVNFILRICKTWECDVYDLSFRMKQLLVKDKDK